METELHEDLEPHQYEDIYEIEDAPLKNISSRTARSMIYFGLCVVVVLGVLSFVIKIPRELNLPFVLKGGREEIFINFPHKIYIKGKFIKTGDHIQQGDSLFMITSPEIVGHIQGIRELERQIAFIDTQKRMALQKNQQAIQTKIDGLFRHITLTDKEIKATLKAQKLANESLGKKVQLLDKQYQRDSQLHQQDIISISELELSQSKLEEARSNLLFTKESYALEVMHLKNNLQSFKSEKQEESNLLESLQLDFDIEKQQTQSTLDQKQQNLSLDYGHVLIAKNTLIMISSTDGSINMINESESDLLSEEVLAKIQTNASQYYAYAEASPKQIGQLEKNQSVVLKLESFPHYYYGVMKAKIEIKSNSPNAKGNYPIHTMIVDPGTLGDRITKGMTGRATVLLEEKNIFDHVFRVFLKRTSFD